MDNPAYASGTEYETKEPIKPTITNFDNYTFVSGYSDSASTLGMYYKNKQINFWTSIDSYFDTIMKVNLNMDDIPDFIYENAFEDGSSLYALISISKTKFIEKEVTDNYHGTYCIESDDTLTNLQPLLIMDVNNNGNNEIILNLIKLNNQLINISCTDTFYIDK